MKQETHVSCRLQTADCTEGLRRSMAEELVMLAPSDRIRRDPTLKWLRVRTTLGSDLCFCSLEN
jgi:hypothetical protein